MNEHLIMKELPETQRPYERCEQEGASVLTDAELLAIILRSGSVNMRVVQVAEQILNMNPNFPGLLGLHHTSQKELMRIHGVGRVKAIQLMAISELTKRMAQQSVPLKVVFTDPETVASYFMEKMRHLEQEQIRIALLDAKSRLLKEHIVSKGTVNASLAAPREVFYTAMREGAVSIVLLHNHPSGDPTPSEEDKLVTRRMKETSMIVGIPLVDHIIIGDNCYVSLRESNLL